ncbi:uncharacterized protein I206_104840 [Kwoniella pini CBS 10737]|uniref:Uncharacterized protein n=1 Tax=Kwoniella pini CBS 10737 TaxID=1296096 RepID=A0A1B9I807_9TREE|nr:uncharacterized protein I206_02380 [Kwoniella pini CBS 10737]OCF51665.1 hypothetical protein I206_02380 [Kwoniella pini CBS 10737]
MKFNGLAKVSIRSHDLSDIKKFDPEDHSEMLTFDSILNYLEANDKSKMIHSGLSKEVLYEKRTNEDGETVYDPSKDSSVTIRLIPAWFRWKDRITETRYKTATFVDVTISPARLHIVE